MAQKGAVNCIVLVKEVKEDTNSVANMRHM